MVWAGEQKPWSNPINIFLATFGSGEPDAFQALSFNERTPASAFTDASLQHISGTRVPAHDLTSIAASATSLEALLPLTQMSNDSKANGNSRPFDTYSEVQALRPTSTWPQKRNGPARTLSSGSAAKIARASTYPRAIAMNVNRSSRGSETDGERPHRNQKIRGKFSDSRRKEVQEIRKKGACIRCRMLRKTVFLLTCHENEGCLQDTSALTVTHVAPVQVLRAPDFGRCLACGPAWHRNLSYTQLVGLVI